MGNPRPQYCQRVPLICEIEGTFGKPRATKLLEYASEMPGCETCGKLKAMILLEHASDVPGWGILGKVKAIVLPEYACEVPSWEAF